MRILALDTATEGCSAALMIDDRMSVREVESERGHAEQILTLIDELLAEAQVRLAALDAIAFGRGPGSFTGVRLAASVTQGLAFGAGLPVVPVSDLLAVAQRAAGTDVRLKYALVCNDARMREVYWACCERPAGGLMRLVGGEHVSRPGRVTLPAGWNAGAVYGLGRGFQAYEELRTGPGAHLAGIDGRILPSAREIALLGAAEVAAGRALDAEHAIPIYLRDDVARPRP